ncbi:MAG: hypothetical protein ACJ73S_13115 [Mycobacteriales bacterium]
MRPRLFTRPGRRVCRRCKGTGMRLRRGTRLINHARQIHHDATH